MIAMLPGWRTLCACALVLFASMLPAHPAPATISHDAVAWRERHPVVRVGVFSGDHLPFEAWIAGEPQGLGVDYARLLASRAGLKIAFIPFDDWNMPAATRAAEYPVLVGQRQQPAGSADYHFLLPYAVGRLYIVARQGDLRIRREKDLAHARIVVERHFRQTAADLARRFPDAVMLLADDGRQALDMLSRGEADVYVGTTSARTQTLLRQRSTNNLVMLAPLSLPSFPIGLAVSNQQPALFELLKHAESSVKPDELSRLRGRWGLYDGVESSLPTAVVSPTERAFLAHLPPLRLGYESDRPPFSFSNSAGEFDGLAADYVNLLKVSLGIRVELVPARDWGHLQQMVLDGEVDMIAAAAPGDFSPKTMLISRPYERFPTVIVARVSGPGIAGTEDLKGLRVATRTEASLLDELRLALPRTTLVNVQTNEEGLARLDAGSVEAYIGTLPAIDPLIRGRYAGKLRVVGPAELDKELSIGVSPQYAPLMPLIDRTLGNIGDAERQKIRRRWLTIDYQYGLPWPWAAAVALAALAVVGLLGLAYWRTRREVRARSAAETALEGQLRFQSALQDALPYPLFVKDALGHYVSVNPAYEQRFGVRAADLIGRTKFEVGHHPADDLDRLDAIEAEAMGTSEAIAAELNIVSPVTGQLHHELLWLKRLELRPGQPGLIGAAVDITKIKVAESKARLYEQRLAEITSTLPAVVFQLRAPPSGRRIFTYVAGDTLSTIGLTPEQITGDEMLAFAQVHPDDRALTEAMLLEGIRTMTPVPEFELRMYTNQGLKWIRTAGGQPRRTDDGSVEWSGYWIDVTRAHQQAEVLQQAKLQAEAAVAARSAFLAMMSHEIRTPMAEIIGLVELATADAQDPEQAETLALVQDSANGLLQILDDILDFSRIESGLVELDVQAFDLRAVMDMVIGLFSTRARTKGLAFSCVLDGRLADTYSGDAMRIRQIVTNLISNALKFTQSGGVELQVERRQRDGDRDHLVFSVHDTGIGIAAEQLGNLFSPFVQADVSTSRRHGGTGLGLTICRRLATLMGGRIDLTSEAGSGTVATLSVALPVVAATTGDSPFAGKKALVCSENERSRREVVQALAALGFDVGTATCTTADAAWAPELLVVDATEDLAALPPGVPTLHLIGGAESRDPKGVDPRLVLHTQPLRVRATANACRAAFGMDSLAPSVRRLPGATHRQPRARILVAEDQSINRLVIGRQLERLGYAFTLVAGGEEALQELAGAGYDLLLTDCQMPKMDGYALARRVRGMERTTGRHLPIIALSAAALPEQVERCREAGMDDFIAKPVRIAALDEKIMQTLSRIPAAEATPSALPGPPASGSHVAHLLTLFGGMDAARMHLTEWFAEVDRDMHRLDQLESGGDRDGQRELLHSMEGVLLMLTGRPSNMASDKVEISVRRQSVLDGVAALKALVFGA
ncbi:ATP-binding protein [Stenotrophomonas sp. PD6]|uniref:ATP-binding protein n=1 Tax=Stenotrophomonas sp. PD6 TaxID=3368612 RepID=UPI003BA38A39